MELGEPVYFGHSEDELAELAEISSIEFESPDTAEIRAYIEELGRRALLPGKPMAEFHKEAQPQSAVPSDFAIRAYPTPFNSTVTVIAKVPEDGVMVIEVYDASGKFVYSLFSDEIAAGQWNFTWDGINDEGINMPGGIYFIKASCSGYDTSVKVVLVK